MCCVLGPTVTIVSAKGKKFGGFAKTCWIPTGRNGAWTGRNGSWQRSAGNFLFMVEPHIKMTCNQPTYAQFSHWSRGPIFGEYNGGSSDLCISCGCLTNDFSNADAVGRSYGATNSISQQEAEAEAANINDFKALGKFQVTEYEVFSVI